MVAADGNVRGPAQLVLTASVARRYYLDGRSKIEIATKGDVRRAKLYYLRSRIGKRAKVKERR